MPGRQKSALIDERPNRASKWGLISKVRFWAQKGTRVLVISGEWRYNREYPLYRAWSLIQAVIAARGWVYCESLDDADIFTDSKYREISAILFSLYCSAEV